MRTPRPAVLHRRPTSTLVGNGFLRPHATVGVRTEAAWPQAWADLRGSALRRCMFMPLPPGARDAEHALAPRISPAALPPRPSSGAEHAPPPPARRPERDVRMMPALSPEDVRDARLRALYAAEQAKALGRRPVVTAGADGVWYEDPIAVGALLLLVPPIGLAALWTSKRYSNDARWALTIVTGLTMCLAAAAVMAFMLARA